MKNNELKLGAMLSYMTLFLSNIIGIVYTPIMLRLMGQTEYGLYSLVASIVGYLTILDMGLGNAIVKYVAKYRALGDRNGEDNLNGMFLIIYILMGIISAILGGLLCVNVKNIFAHGLSAVELNKAYIMMILLVFNISISFPLGIFGSIMTAYEKFVFPKIVNIIRVLINPCIMIPLLLMGYKSVMMVLVITILNITCLLTNVWYCFYKINIKIKFNRWDNRLLKEVMGYSFFIFLNIIIDKLYWSTDQMILGIVSGTTVVAIYAIGSQLNGYYMNFSTAISSVFLPKITTMITKKKSNQEVSNLFIRVARIQYLIMSFILTGFILFGKQFIVIWAGQEYISSYYISLLVMIPSIVPLTQNIGISILQAKNLHKFRSVVYLFIAIINIILSIPLAKLWGGIGCAIATSIAIILGQIIIMNIYYHKKAKIDILLYWKEVIKMSKGIVIALILGVLLVNIFDLSNVIIYVICILIYSLIFLLSVWKMSMNHNEKQLVYDLKYRLTNKYGGLI